MTEQENKRKEYNSFMELNRKELIMNEKVDFSNDMSISDPQSGLNWKKNMCSRCKFNEGRTCKYYNKDRLEVPVDIFDCPSFEEKDEDKAMKIMGV